MGTIARGASFSLGLRYEAFSGGESGQSQVRRAERNQRYFGTSRYFYLHMLTHHRGSTLGYPLYTTDHPVYLVSFVSGTREKNEHFV